MALEERGETVVEGLLTTESSSLGVLEHYIN